MNRLERPGPVGIEAIVEFGDGEFRVVRQGTFVRCSVTGQVIPLDELRYWSVERQEAYASPEAALVRLRLPNVDSRA